MPADGVVDLINEARKVGVVILADGTRASRTHLAIALACICGGARGRFFNTVLMKSAGAVLQRATLRSLHSPFRPLRRGSVRSWPTSL